MHRALALLVTVLLVSLACGGPTVSRSISPDRVGTKYARLTGYFGTSAAAPGGKHEEEVPGHLQHDIVRDEATLVQAAGGEVCFDVVVRTESQYDEPFEQLAPGCEVDGDDYDAIAEGELVSVADYGYDGSETVMRAEAMTASDFLGLSIKRPVERVFRVVSREARLCCPAPAGEAIALSLSNERREVAGYDYKLTFAWTLR